jgi:hypothetical protein
MVWVREVWLEYFVFGPYAHTFGEDGKGRLISRNAGGRTQHPLIGQPSRGMRYFVSIRIVFWWE